MNNKLLLLILAVLLAAFGIYKLTGGDSESTFDPQIIQVDTAAVTAIVLRSKADNFETATLEKKDGEWSISKNGKTYYAPSSAVGQLLQNLVLVTTNRIVAKSPEKWAQYEIEDDAASRIEVFAGDKTLADFYVGKYSVNQQAQQITSYIRVAGKDDVYAVDGMAGMMLGQGSAAYRLKQVTKIEIHDVEKLNCTGDAVYTVERDGPNWLLDNDAMLDTTKVLHFLMNIRSMAGDTFVDDFDPAVSQDKLLKTLTISGSNMPGDVVVRCWKDEAREKPFVIHSSQYPNSFFASDSTRLFTRLFKPVNEW